MGLYNRVLTAWGFQVSIRVGFSAPHVSVSISETSSGTTGVFRIDFAEHHNYPPPCFLERREYSASLQAARKPTLFSVPANAPV